LIVLGNHLLRNHQLGKRLDLTSLGVYPYTQFARWPDRLLGGHEQRVLHSGDQDITADALFPLPKFQNRQEICVHIVCANPIRGTKKSAEGYLPTLARWSSQQT
jgi:hypothetical protein